MICILFPLPNLNYNVMFPSKYTLKISIHSCGSFKVKGLNKLLFLQEEVPLEIKFLTHTYIMFRDGNKMGLIKVSLNL